MKQTYIRCKVEPGLFPTERLIEIRYDDKGFRFIVPDTSISDEAAVQAWVISETRDTLWVEISGEPMSSGPRIEVPKGIVREAA